MIEQLIINIQRKIANITGKHQLRISFWGNDIIDAFQYHYDFTNFSESFLAAPESEFQPANVFLIVGQLNKIQVVNLKERIEKLNLSKKFIIHVKSGMNSNIAMESYMGVPNLSDFFDVNLTFERSPMQLDELIQEIIELKDGVHAE